MSMSAEEKVIRSVFRDGGDPKVGGDPELRKQAIRAALLALPSLERKVLELRFGFDGEPWEIEAIGVEIGRSRDEVRAIEGQALTRLAALRELAMKGVSMNHDVQFSFNGPPPSKEPSASLDPLRAACDAHPGEWATVECGTVSRANSRRERLRKAGYQATQRKTLLYVRAVTPQQP